MKSWSKQVKGLRKLVKMGEIIVKDRLNNVESDPPTPTHPPQANDDSDQIDLGIGEQTCGLTLPMELLIGSSVGAGEWKSPEKHLFTIFVLSYHKNLYPYWIQSTS